MDKSWPIAIDLFSGCGGVTEGLRQARFRVVAAVDIDPICSVTYKNNHKSVKFYNDDIRVVDPHKLARVIPKGKELDLLTVCAPCQPFSSQNRDKGHDLRTGLILEALKFIRILNPKVIFFENVPGLAETDVFIELQEELHLYGYNTIEPLVIDAADYGVPQRRPRFIYLASRTPEPITVPTPVTRLENRITVRDAIGDLKILHSGEKDQDDSLHIARKHKEIALKRLSFIPKNGGSRSSLPDDLQLNCHKNHNGHKDVYGRMSWDTVAPTLTTGCTNITRGRFAHPSEDRSITVREAARLQTFPDNYKFHGKLEQIATQVGNAVPVAMMKNIACHIRKHVRG
ncbi:DNA cytosine methyltransferase [Paenibacillus sp. FSL M7-0420]|uniref:DNA cytosine methyltransferase n=1 Tax=Paenibacillus sp. FSL M7-0420 TaxID=2921609 RepID=UPI0030F73660